MPITFVLDYSRDVAHTEFERFAALFNMIEKHKDDDLDTLNQGISNNVLITTQKYSSLSLPSSMFCGKNLWLLKPTSLNRGRGVTIFNSIPQLKKLILEYQSGQEQNPTKVVVH